ncbi:MAG: hypothetical protein ACOCWG_06175 [bacterium]
MFVEVIAFCIATLPANIEQDMCSWYSDVDTYYSEKQECLDNANDTINDPRFLMETKLILFENYNYVGEIEYVGYCIEAKNLYNFFRENNLKTKDIPETT